MAGGDLRIGVIATNTMLASASGAFCAMLYMWMFYGKPDISVAANNLLAGMVAINAPYAFVNSVSAVIIGAVACVLLCVAVFLVERTLKIDNSVGDISVHGVNDAWGVLALSLFADGLNTITGLVTGLFYGDASQFAAQVIGVIIMFIFFKVLDMIVPLHVKEDQELEVLNQSEVAVVAYPDFSLKASHR